MADFESAAFNRALPPLQPRGSFYLTAIRSEMPRQAVCASLKCPPHAARRTRHDSETLPSPRLHSLCRLRRAIHRHLGNLDILGHLDTQLLAQLAINSPEDLPVLLQEAAHILASLADALPAVAVPRSRFLNDVMQHREVQHIAFARDALAVQNVELGIAERRRHLVLHNLHLGA